MTVKVDVKWKFKVNGKEYSSRDQMPESIRQAYDKALANSTTDGSTGSETRTTKIVFNGQEYSSVDSMPAGIRQFYKKVLGSTQRVGADDSGLAGGGKSLAQTILTQHGHTDWAMSDKAIAPGTSASSSQRLLVAGFLVLALLSALYFLFRAG